jgi:hypothetical protein
MHLRPNAIATWAQSSLLIVCKVFKQPCNATIQVLVLLLAVNFLTHFDVCLIHLLLLFRNRCFPPPLSVYKHLSVYKLLLFSRKTTLSKLTFLIELCLGSSSSWLLILRIPCIICFWSSTIGFPVQRQF